MKFSLYPDAAIASAYDIPYEKLYALGYRGIIYDIDNTLVEHDQPATERSIQLFQKLHSIGFETTLVSNNKEPRVKAMAEAVNAHYIYKAGKPKASGYEKAMKIMGTDPGTTFSVGDQLFTDIWGSQNAGVPSYLVNPIAKHEEIQIVLKRILEKPILTSYHHHVAKKGQEWPKFK